MFYSDQTKIFDPHDWCYDVHLIGAGGINSAVGPLLVKMGIATIHAWDADTLNQRNLPTEIGYSAKDAGQPKVIAMGNTINYLLGNKLQIDQHNETIVYSCTGNDGYSFQYTGHIAMVDENTSLSGVVIAGVDSMASRHKIWEAIKANSVNIPLYIDARSGGEDTTIFAFSPIDYQASTDYETWLFDDSEAKQLPCGARNIGYIGAYMAYWIGRIITRFSRNYDLEFRKTISHNLYSEN